MGSRNRRMERHRVVPHSQSGKQDDRDIQNTFAYLRKQSHLTDFTTDHAIKIF